jgi:hypothetical protein
MIIRLPASVNDDYAGVDFVEVEVTKDIVALIRTRQRQRKELACVAIEDWSYAITAYDGLYDEVVREVAVTDVRMRTTDLGVYWVGYLKHTEIEVSTDYIPEEALREVEQTTQEPA